MEMNKESQLKKKQFFNSLFIVEKYLPLPFSAT